MRALATGPETDYLAAGYHARERAMAYLLVQALSHLGDLPAPGLAPTPAPIDHLTAFACTQLADPARYARAALLLGNLDPDVLRPLLLEDNTV